VSSKKIVITGGPGTGKTTIVQSLKDKGYICLPEISRQVILEARESGIDQLFLENPLLFSEKLLEGREKQYDEAQNHPGEIVFIDRGIPDIIAYMDYMNEPSPYTFEKAGKEHIYDLVFLLPPWKEIYIPDNERYENFEQAVNIHDFLEKTYKRFGYDPIEVPVGKIDYRTSFIEEVLKNS